MNQLEKRQAEIDKAVENLENFRLKQIELYQLLAPAASTTPTKVSLKGYLGGIFIFLMLGIVSLLSNIFPQLSLVFFLIFFIILYLLLSYSDAGEKKLGKFSYDDYKQVVKKDLIEALFPNIGYVKDGDSFKKMIETSLLLEHSPSIKDHFYGMSKNRYNFEFADVDSVSDKISTFKGFFFMIKSPDLSCEKIIILRKSLVHEKKLEDLTRVHLEGVFPEFEANYTVLSSDISEAEKLLTADFLKPIYELSQRWNVDIRWSFIGNQIYVAIKTDKDIFASYPIFRSFKERSWPKDFCNNAIPYIDAIEAITVQLKQIPEKIKIELKENKTKLLDDDSAYDHLVDE